jgi:hypothetical protein
VADKDPTLKYEPHGNGDEAEAAECGENRRDCTDSRILK